MGEPLTSNLANHWRLKKNINTKETPARNDTIKTVLCAIINFKIETIKQTFAKK